MYHIIQIVVPAVQSPDAGKGRHYEICEAYTRLEPERRARLRWALLVVDPSHRWIERLK